MDSSSIKIPSKPRKEKQIIRQKRQQTLQESKFSSIDLHNTNLDTRMVLKKLHFNV